MTVSPIWVTMPPSTLGSTTTTMSTSLPVAALSDAARPGLLVLGELDRRADLGDVAVTARRGELEQPVDDAGQLADPAVADHERHERHGGVGRLAGQQVLADLRATGGGEVRVAEGVAQLVVALDHAGEPEQLVLDLVEVAFGRDHLEERLGVEQGALVAHDWAPTWLM